MWFMDKAGKTAATPDLEVLVHLFGTPFEKIRPIGITCPQYNPTKKVCQIYKEREQEDCSCLYNQWQEF